MHGGIVQAESEGKDRGATFIVALPIILQAETVEVSDQPVRADSLDGLTVLVVEDNDDAREMLVAMLEAHGARAVAASCSEDGVRLFDEQHPDLIVADIGLPDEDGYSFIRRVRAHERDGTAQVPAVAITALATPRDRGRALSAGYQLHLAKGSDPNLLVSALATLANREEQDPSELDNV